MKETIFMTAQEVADLLGVSKGLAYRIIKDMNKQLQNEGYITIFGKINRTYFNEKIYEGRDYGSLQRG